MHGGETEQAAASWGGEWRMPSKDDFQELIDNCTWNWTTRNNVNGYLVVGKNDNIFLPEAGMCLETYYGGNMGVYWTSTPHNTGNTGFIVLQISDRLVDCSYNNSSFNRYIGCSVRPITGGNK